MKATSRVFLVILRLVIGWHFLVEGLYKFETPWSSEAYLRESILTPAAKITGGFQPIMPAFQGLISEEQLLELIEYVKSLRAQPQTETARPTAAGPAPGENTPVRR